MTENVMRAFQLDQLAHMILLAIFKCMQDDYQKCTNKFLLLIHFENVTSH